MQRGIATLLAIALALWAVGLHMFTSPAEAANLTYVKDTLSDSAPSTASNHEIEFLSPTGVAANGYIEVTFPTQFTGTSSVVFTDLDLEINGVDETLVAGAPGAAQWGFAWQTGNTFRLTAGSAESLGANATATIKIGSNADGPGANLITNPSATTSYELYIVASSSSGVDTGRTRVAIIENVLVTAVVDTTLSFIVNGTSTASTVNGTTTNITTTNTTIPFGTLSAGEIKTGAQDLYVTTNAANGYVVTVEESSDGIVSSTGADIDDFADNDATTTPIAWVSPSNNVNDENTWGHWGLTSTDANTTRTDEFGSNQWVSASTSPVVIMSHTDPSDGTTAGIGRATIGYQIEITSLQEAGDDYQTTLTYIATPTF